VQVYRDDLRRRRQCRDAIRGRTTHFGSGARADVGANICDRRGALRLLARERKELDWSEVFNSFTRPSAQRRSRQSTARLEYLRYPYKISTRSHLHLVEQLLFLWVLYIHQ
jgi:hypothetical protein